MIEQGGIQGVDRIFSVHCDPTLDVGQVGLRVGALTAAADAVTITLSGRGGHTSRPHLTQDLVYALGKVVTDVPGALSRRVDPRAGVALVWGTVHSGNADNVIPSTGTVSGTLRMLDAQLWEDIGPLLEELVHAVISPYAVSARVEHVRGRRRWSTILTASRSCVERPSRPLDPTPRSPHCSPWAVRTSPGTCRRCRGPWRGWGRAPRAVRPMTCTRATWSWTSGPSGSAARLLAAAALGGKYSQVADG